MKIFVAADHNGFQYREKLLLYLQYAGYDVHDDGTKSLDPQDDFPLLAERVVTDMRTNDDPDTRGILLCGSGQGMCMAANRFNGIRAVLGYDVESVRSARHDDDANVLCMPAHALDEATMKQLVEIFLVTKFANAPRFVRRIRELDEFRG